MRTPYVRRRWSRWGRGDRPGWGVRLEFRCEAGSFGCVMSSSLMGVKIPPLGHRAPAEVSGPSGHAGEARPLFDGEL